MRYPISEALLGSYLYTVFSRKSQYSYFIYAHTQTHLANHYCILVPSLGCGTVSEQAVSYATLLLYMPCHFSLFFFFLILAALSWAFGYHTMAMNLLRYQRHFSSSLPFLFIFFVYLLELSIYGSKPRGSRRHLS